MWPMSFGVVKHRAGRARVLGHGGYQDALTLDSFSRMLPSVIGGPGSCLRCAMGVLVGKSTKRDMHYQLAFWRMTRNMPLAGRVFR
jgi:hypothetical protein